MAGPEDKEKIYWNSIKTDPLGADAHGTSLIQRGDTIFFHAEHFDREDQRQSSADADFPKTSFRDAIDRLQKTGSAMIPEDPTQLYNSIRMKMDPETKTVDVTVYPRNSIGSWMTPRISVPLAKLIG